MHATHPAPRQPFRFNGWHMTGILVAFFGTVIAVNVYMAHLALSTFSGEVVENSYNASQAYNGWLAEAAREKALGWSAEMARRGDGRLVAHIAGKGTAGAVLTAEAWRPLGGTYGAIRLNFARGTDGAFVSDKGLAAGRWDVRLTVTASGHMWRNVTTL